MSRVLGIALSTALFVSVASAPAHAATTVTELDRLPGTTAHQAEAVNDAGVAVGTATLGGQIRAVRWDADGGIRDLGGPASAPDIRAKAVNSAGVVAGQVGTKAALRFDLDGTHTVLSTPPDRRTTVTGIDDTGVVYGYYLDPVGLTEWVAVRWDVHGVPTPLAVPEGTRFSQVNSVSPNGFATGWIDDGTTRAVRWNPDGSYALLDSPGSRSSKGTGVNRHGDVVGESEGRSVRWNSNGSTTEFGGNGRAAWIDDSGSVVSTVNSKPYRWNAAGERIALPLPAGTYVGRVTAVNGGGVAVGSAGDVDEMARTAVRWTSG
ncbi:hypothetical protein [Lentzea jiangxiensis]|uniref:YD repeat-containing protein n=1 Tax=Lentzea jiangxiensis TaxID=641025 RepID=A0A1H0IGZ6_9PSEU|nr:hypothetical protein [Lentzea jiangxiensis]SDO30663.1 hypothetical protein SAMN05421507_102100 [Lentzea jiangxiensis]